MIQLENLKPLDKLPFKAVRLITMAQSDEQKTQAMMKVFYELATPDELKEELDEMDMDSVMSLMTEWAEQAEAKKA